ncbi:BTAD domain-containing putative transcriptional regulator [Actinomadura flavalba]|uniref:BTAD domain-containing putative transcriptional regulator n=1 Tax=Actinomadura flavalba TaxID=1120938 RepID=UPI00037EBB95|nr:BTAD domain-containing putative transcriptional regulator [Actinomadura flavalba]
MRVAILGPVEVTADGRAVAVAGARLRALLTLLALDAGRFVPAADLVDALWGDDPPAPNALQSLVSRLRAALGRDAVDSRPGAYRLAVPADAVDARVFRAEVARARALPDAAARRDVLAAALKLWRGPALADALGTPAADARAVPLETLRRAATEERADAALAVGEHAALIPELEALVAADPLREPLRALLVRARYAAGDQVAALAEYDAIRALLADELGVDPSPELEAVRLAVLRQDPALRPPRREAPSSALTSFVGRDADLARIAELLETYRLVSLTGPGGAGKTRLSLAAAALAGGDTGVVELAPVTDAAEVAAAALNALGLRERIVLPGQRAGPADPLDRLCAGLRGRRMLLVLDNCEHVLDAAARLADRVLAECPGVRVLTTSREALGITGEAVWPVPPLAPENAVALFADRAAAAVPGFAVTPENAADVARVCRALDGMPLAIELAAARLRTLPPRLLAERLDDRFALLTGGSRTALPRHRTLRAVVEWSWDLLDERERLLWQRLAVFHGGATLTDAEEVCAGDGLARADVAATLFALVEKSLVTVDGSGRYGMLETIRVYGLERLAASGGEDRARRAHARAFAALASAAEPHLTTDGQLTWIARLTADDDNLAAAARYAVEARDTRTALRMCADLGWYWLMTGRYDEGVEHLRQTLALPDAPRDETTALAYVFGALNLMDLPGEGDAGRTWLARGIEIAAGLGRPPRHPKLRLAATAFTVMFGNWNAEALGLAGVGPHERATVEALVPLFADEDAWTRGFAHFLHGVVVLNFGLTAGLADDFAHAEKAFRESGDRVGLCLALAARGELLGREGQHSAAVALLEEALTVFDLVGGSADMRSMPLTLLANELHLAGRVDEAVALLEDALATADGRLQPEAVSTMHYRLGEFALRAGRIDDARRLLDLALTLPPGVPAPRGQWNTLCARAHVDLACGDVPAARRRLAEALRLTFPVGEQQGVAYILASQAALDLHLGDPVRAAELLGTAEALRGGHDLSQPDVTATEESVAAALSPTDHAAARARGRARTRDEITSLITDPPP